MWYLPRLLPPLAAALLLAWCTPLPAQVNEKKPDPKKPAGTEFIRVPRDAKGQPIAVETATVRYVTEKGDAGLVVDLVGVVHVGDRAYYDALDKQLDGYDVVLYELVAEEGTRIPKGGRRDGDNPLALLQTLLKNVLELESQTERIDYTRKHFVHADLSPEQMGEAIRKRGDTPFTVILNVVSDLMRQQNLKELDKQKNPAKADPELDLFGLLFDPDRAIKLKRIMADQFEGVGKGTGLGDTLNTILVSDRNQAAMKVLQKEVARGKKKVAIFYGAAHMPDFEKRLKEEYGLKPDKTTWLRAWDMEIKEKKEK